ncbi:unnamed protein product [Brassica rapa subsp. narinosa]
MEYTLTNKLNINKVRKKRQRKLGMEKNRIFWLS